MTNKFPLQNYLLGGDTGHLGQSLGDGLAVKRALAVTASASDLGSSSLSQVGSKVVFGLGGSRVNGAALAEKSSDHVLLRGPFL